MSGDSIYLVPYMDDYVIAVSQARPLLYREVYTVRFEEVIYVLHVFQKKSKKGIATPKEDVDLIKSRLKWAEALYKEHYGKKKSKK